MNTRTAACTALLALATLTAGCNSDSTSDDVKNTPSKSTSTPATAAAAASPSATPRPLKVGVSHKWADTDLDGSPVSGTTTVLNYTQPAKDVELPKAAADFADPEWAILEIKVCTDPTSSTVSTSQGPWSLGFPEDTRLDAPGISGGGVPKPEYPVDGARAKAGICLRGKTTFSVDKRTRPTLVIYAPEGRDPIERAVPTACTIHGRVRRATPAVTGLFAPHCEPPVTQPCSSHTSRTRMRRTPRRLRP
ncbi:hypothetical protein [Streptomyces griseorubiginosus]|uniref:hypothetical protein n=1 Tax=Streptomyces griseorubiginosus TaxID=67304 RepID=UPI0036E5077C